MGGREGGREGGRREGGGREEGGRREGHQVHTYFLFVFMLCREDQLILIFFIVMYVVVVVVVVVIVIVIVQRLIVLYEWLRLRYHMNHPAAAATKERAKRIPSATSPPCAVS